MHESDIVRLNEYFDEIVRSRLRFRGIGPKESSNGNPETCMWPQLSVDPERQTKSMFHPDLIRCIGDPQQVQRLKGIMCKVFKDLRRCHLKSLFDRHCPMDKACRRKENPDLMQGFATPSQVLGFLHAILRSIRIGHRSNRLKYLFGSYANFDIYKQSLKWLIVANATQIRMKSGQFVHQEHRSMDLSLVQWLNGLNDMAKYRVFLHLVIKLNWFLSQTIKRYFYITVSNPYNHKLFYYRYDLWQRLQAYVMKGHLASGLLHQIKVTDVQMADLQTSRIRFHLKCDSLRLICTNGKNRIGDQHYQLRAALEYMLRNMPYADRYNAPRSCLLSGIKYMHDISMKVNKPIYLVRADMENCFHSIDQAKLKGIIMNFLKSTFPNNVLKFQRLEFCLSNNRKFTKWSLDPEVDQKLHATKYTSVQRLGNPELVNLDTFDRKSLEPLIMMPLLREPKDSTVAYRLMRGIRQGSQLSPSLCGIYIREALNTSIQDILTSDDSKCFIHVDDILLMTTSREKAEKFLDTLIVGLAEFNLKSNSQKLVTNFDSTKHAVTRLEEHVMFYKRKIDIKTLACSYGYSTDSIGIEDTFAVSPFCNEKSIKETVSKFTKIDALFLCFELNGARQVFRNLFEYALLTAYRVVTLLKVSFIMRDHGQQRPAFLKELIRMTAKKLHGVNQAAGRDSVVCNSMSDKEIHLIVAGAFLATWKLKRVSSRAREREFLDRYFNRLMQRYIVFHDDCDDDYEIRGVPVEKIIRDLVANFPESDFCKHMLLPKKC